MKKILTILFVSTVGFFSSNLNAQGFYLDFNVGYGVCLPKNVLGQEIHNSQVNFKTTSETKNLMGSLGKGLNLQLTPGYMINNHIGIELGINYFMGGKEVMNSITTSIDNPAKGSIKAIKDDNYEMREDVAHSNQLRISPALYLSTGFDEKISGYAKLGIIMPVYGSTMVNSTEVSALNIGGKITKENKEMYTEVNGAPSFGFKGAIGLNYRISDNLSVFGEIHALSLNIKTKSRKTTSYKVDGVEVIDKLPAYSTQIEYVEELNKESNNKDYNTNYDLDRPLQDIYSKTSFSQFGIQIGVKYNF